MGIKVEGVVHKTMVPDMIVQKEKEIEKKV